MTLPAVRIIAADSYSPLRSCILRARQLRRSEVGVSTLPYAPYAIFCYASPVLSVLYGFTGFRVEKVEADSSPVNAEGEGP